MAQVNSQFVVVDQTSLDSSKLTQRVALFGTDGQPIPLEGGIVVTGEGEPFTESEATFEVTTVGGTGVDEVWTLIVPSGEVGIVNIEDGTGISSTSTAEEVYESLYAPISNNTPDFESEDLLVTGGPWGTAPILVTHTGHNAETDMFAGPLMDDYGNMSGLFNNNLQADPVPGYIYFQTDAEFGSASIFMKVPSTGSWTEMM